MFNPEHKKSNLIYCPEKRSAQQFVLDIGKTVNELGYEPKFSWKDYLVEFKKDMKEQPFGKLWGFESDYIK